MTNVALSTHVVLNTTLAVGRRASVAVTARSPPRRHRSGLSFNAQFKGRHKRSGEHDRRREAPACLNGGH
jgi:hypothetical protein